MKSEFNLVCKSLQVYILTHSSTAGGAPGHALLSLIEMGRLRALFRCTLGGASREQLFRTVPCDVVGRKVTHRDTRLVG